LRAAGGTRDRGHRRAKFAGRARDAGGSLARVSRRGSPPRIATAAATMLAAMALVAGARRAEASEPASWRVPAECGGPGLVVARVKAQAGRPLTDADPISVDVAITAGERGYVADVDIVSVRGAARRRVEGTDCGAVVDAVALVLAVAMQEAPSMLDTSRPVVPASARSRFLVGFALGVDQAALPSPSPGAAVVLALGRGPLRLELGGEVYQAAFAPSPMDEQVGVDVGLLGGRARLCRWLGPLRACAGGAVGRLQGRPVGPLARRSTGSRRWSALLAGVGWSYRFGGRFAVGLDVEGVLALDRPAFAVEEASELQRVYQPATGGVRVGGGLEVEIR
jgi:hypothetical protein